ncbi:MAG: sigma-54 dependent transcriptional regulator [Victivallaceae bacterium]|nr:sigma-54 dependent transcriptional regulator [Victivallaceae bacterium]
MSSSILIVDDEINTREALSRYLRGRFEVVLASDGAEAIELLSKRDFDLVLTDLRMPRADGMSVLEATLAKANVPVCILFTAYGSVEKAVEAVRAGAFDFVVKPVKLTKLDEVIQKALASRAARQPVAVAPGEASGVQPAAVSDAFLVGDSPAMREIATLVRKLAPAKTTVLLTGESGSGKEVIARALHTLSGRTGLFVPVHCAALSENLLESELFGHEKGAFTGAVERRKGRFELANDGTLFLDEIGEIPSSVQIKLLRVLESRSFERVGGDQSIECTARVVSATNRDLAQMVREGSFREDLFYRLDVVNLHLPPLRERATDIPLLAGRFAAESARDNGKPDIQIDPEAMRMLCRYPWPGNIRELKNCIERLVVLGQGECITAEEVEKFLYQRNNASGAIAPVVSSPAPEVSSAAAGTEPTLNLNLGERELIERALDACRGNRTKAAEKLGISRRTLQRRLKEFGSAEDKETQLL